VTYAGDVLSAATKSSLLERVAAASGEHYAMALFAKWHLGYTARQVRDHGVPEFRGFLRGGVSNYFDWTWTDFDANSTRRSTCSTTAMTDFAIDFINDHKARSDDPWFVWLAYNAPQRARGCPCRCNRLSDPLLALERTSLESALAVLEQGAAAGCFQ